MMFYVSSAFGLLLTLAATVVTVINPSSSGVQAFTPVSVSKSTLLLYHPHRTSRQVGGVLLHDTTVTPSSSSSSSKSKRLPSDDLLEKGQGKINPELAQRLWKWEQEQRLNLQILEDYSTRRGLRWVKDLVLGKYGGSNTRSTEGIAVNRPNYEDLIQEGVIALMQSLKSFEHKARPNESFETFAKKRIQHALDSYMLEREKGTGEIHGKTQSHRHPLSVESTVQVMGDPFEAHNYYFNQDEWEKREGLILDDGKSLHRDELVDDFLDENIKSEGDDQMWVHEQQVAAPLRESIPATERNEGLDDYDDDDESGDPLSLLSSPEDVILQDMLLNNVDNFLSRSSLDDVETRLIQMQFGLDDGVPKPQKEIAWELNLTVNQVRRMRKRALMKLRDAFTTKYVDDTSHEDLWEDTP
jgi:RNA polymerase sigma factor (sigma-70 family)